MARAELLWALVLLVPVAPLLGEIATMGDKVKFTAGEKCARGEEMKLTRRMRDDRPVQVATLSAVWMPATELYKGRIKHLSALSFYLTDVHFNDNGWYEFTCGSRVQTVFELVVVSPAIRSVIEGESAALPCHSFTAGQDVQPVQWKKAETLVAELDPASRRIKYGSGFAGRMLVSPDWWSTGDVSLTLERVQADDHGDYICYGHDKDGKRKVVVLRLKINEREVEQITSTPTQRAHEEKPGTWTTAGITAAVVIFIVVPVAAGLGWWMRSRSS